MRSRKSPWQKYVGHDVRIEWKDPNHDWPTFHVVLCVGTGARLRGIADGDAPHDGSFVMAWWREVAAIKFLAPQIGDSSYSELIEGGAVERSKGVVDGRDKQDNYGPPHEFVARLAKMWSGYLGTRLNGDLAGTDVAMMMALLKAARLSTNPSHEDSLVDFAGWTRIYERVK